MGGKVSQLWHPKTKERRYIPISDEIRSLILKQRKTPGELLFQNTNKRSLMDRKVLERFQDCCQKAGLKKEHVHSLRHIFCSITTEKGIPAEVIQAILGHKSDSMTRRYRHLKPEFLGDMMKGFRC
jgi:site-specific recombinase XerD